MGKGDKKTKRGKLFKGSHGKLHPRKKVKDVSVKVKPEVKAEDEPKTKEKKAVKKKE